MPHSGGSNLPTRTPLISFGSPDVFSVSSKVKEGAQAWQESQNNASQAKSTTSTTSEDYANWWKNAFTGQIDYDRLNEMWQKAADYNTAAVREQREYQAQREDTAVLRYADQLKQLGLNPALVVGHQAGASGGNTASMSTSSPSSIGSQGLSLLELLVNTASDLLDGSFGFLKFLMKL